MWMLPLLNARNSLDSKKSGFLFWKSNNLLDCNSHSLTVGSFISRSEGLIKTIRFSSHAWGSVILNKILGSFDFCASMRFRFNSCQFEGTFSNCFFDSNLIETLRFCTSYFLKLIFVFGHFQSMLVNFQCLPPTICNWWKSCYHQRQLMQIIGLIGGALSGKTLFIEGA